MPGDICMEMNVELRGQGLGWNAHVGPASEQIVSEASEVEEHFGSRNGERNRHPGQRLREHQHLRDSN